MQTLSVNEPKSDEIVVGDKLTVTKNGRKVRIRVEYVSDDHVEGSVIKTTANFKQGQYVAAWRSLVKGNKRFNAPDPHMPLD